VLDVLLWGVNASFVAWTSFKGGLGISKLQFWSKKEKIFVFSCIFFLQFLVIKTLGPEPDPDSLEMLDPDSMNPDPHHCHRSKSAIQAKRTYVSGNLQKIIRIFVSKRSNSGKMIPIWPDPILRYTTLDVGPSTALCNFLQVGSRKIHRAKLEIDSFLPLFIIFLSGAPYSTA
jgi:hypothetical protein